MRGADQLLSALSCAGVGVIFSVSGNQIMSVYDGAIGGDIEIVHTRHEAGAVYMADGFARCRGGEGVGVALVTAGPGLTNALGPLFAVSKTETPLLLLSGDSPVGQDDKLPFQRMEQCEVASPLVKESWRLADSGRIGDDIAGAIRLARSGRPGAVHISLPQDVLLGDSSPINLNKDAFMGEAMMLSATDLPAILNMLEGKERPLIITGPSLHEMRASGVGDAVESRLNIPVLCMQSPRGLNDPSAGRLKTLLREADSLLLIDKDVDFTLASGDEEVIGAEDIALMSPQAASISHASEVLAGRLRWACMADPISAMVRLMEVETYRGSDAWMAKVREELRARPHPPLQGDKMNAHQISSIIKEKMGEHNPLYVIDGGETGQWAQSVLPSEQSLTNGLSGAIGGAIPQAIGAARARPDRHIVAVMGDGASGFLMSEIETGRRLGLNMTIVICNDYRWGAEVELQKRDFGADRVHGCGLDAETRYDEVARGFGADGILVEDGASLCDALRKSLKGDKPMVINALMEGLPAPSF